MSKTNKPLIGADVAVDDTTKRAILDVNPEAALGTGNPIPLAFSDPGSNDYAAASPPSTTAITRACTRIRAGVGNSGMVISLDGGTTGSITILPNTVDEVGVAVAAGADIQVKRYTAGTAMTNIVVEVR